MKNKIIQGDAKIELKRMKSDSINCCVTSPPYWALRDYGVDGQLGLEPTFQEYINKLCDIFDEVKRVLRKDGTCWVVIGDTYFGSGAGTQKNLPEENKSKEVYTLPYQSFKKRKTRKDSKQLDTQFRTRKRFCCECGKDFIAYPHQYFCGAACSGVDNTPRFVKGIPENKCLCQIPSRFSIEMCNRGWILRNTLIWHKPNCMPSSVKDRFTVDFEYVFFFVKNKKYWFETQYEPHLTQENRPDVIVRNREYNYDSKLNTLRKHRKDNTLPERHKAFLGNAPQGFDGKPMGYGKQGRNKRTVWKINTKPFKEAHFAVFPEELVETPIKAGCPKGGTVLDCFCGSGTSGVVAQRQEKDFIGIELNPEYIEIAKKRLDEGKSIWT